MLQWQQSQELLCMWAQCWQWLQAFQLVWAQQLLQALSVQTQGLDSSLICVCEFSQAQNGPDRCPSGPAVLQWPQN